MTILLPEDDSIFSLSPAELLRPTLGGCGGGISTLPCLTVTWIAPTQPMRMTEMSFGGEITLVVPRDANATIAIHGRAISLGAGEAMLMPSAALSGSVIESTSGLACLAFPSSILTAPPEFHENPALIVAAGGEALRLILSYLDAINTAGTLSSIELRRLCASHVHDLIIAAVGRRGACRGAPRGIRATRLQAIKSDIEANAARPSFSIDDVAKRHGISPRYIRKLFESMGTTFMAFVISRRIAHARQMLLDPQFADQTIGAIAFAAGFTDLSHFNRSFRRAYRATPSEVRQTAQHET